MSAAVGPSLFLATHDDGSQTLVTLWNEPGAPLGEVAHRPNSHSTWSIPTPLEVAP